MKIILILVSVVVTTLLPTAYSSNVTVVAEGVFSEYADPDNLLPFDRPADGTIFTIRFTYDDEVPDQFPDNENYGRYFDALSSINLTIGDAEFDSLLAINSIVIRDDQAWPSAPGGYTDWWRATTRESRPPEGYDGIEIVEGFGLQLITESILPVPPLMSDELNPPPWPAAWQRPEIVYSIILYTDTSSEILATARANVTSISIIPVPQTIWLLGSALCLLGWVRRKLS